MYITVFKVVEIKKNQNYMLIGVFISISISIMSGILYYYTNEPILTKNSIEDDFENKIPGIFPVGWLSAVHPLNVKVVSDHRNNVMEVKDTDSKGVTEVMRRFKKSSEGIIEAKVKPLDIKNGFVIHLVQTDREYDPFDDIIIYFYKGEVYIIGEENIMELDDIDPSFLDQLILTDDEGSVIIDEWNLENFDSMYEYEANEWYSVYISFNREKFTVLINGEYLGDFEYPKYNPPYFAGLYFWTAITPSNFRFYVDNVKITLIQSTDYIHPANILFLGIVLFSLIIVVFIIYKMKSKEKRR